MNGLPLELSHLVDVRCLHTFVLHCEVFVQMRAFLLAILQQEIPGGCDGASVLVGAKLHNLFVDQLFVLGALAVVWKDHVLTHIVRFASVERVVDDQPFRAVGTLQVHLMALAGDARFLQYGRKGLERLRGTVNLRL